ncbi:MAG: LysR family transcriptional regulator [Petrimonas sp.]|uniref:LysR family transcriptional regulator n=1 Tax=Cloacibacillus evryensis TaxID=508460 RepID=UPI0026DFCB0E|nr:LysR family transcriptional regulator [Cloacibacillus evryensis]MEA4948146.1 LysR family transcriptional regulator [Petrimonas sp.]
MDISKLQVFLKVLEHKNLTKAAESLGYTQSGITHIINGIEKEVGFRLLKRCHSGVSLTLEGEQLVQFFMDLVDINHQMNNKISQVKGLAQGSIRIGSYTSVTLFYLPEILKEFLQQHPNIDVSLMKGNCSDMEKCLDEGTIDVAFLSQQDYHNYDFIELLQDPIYAAMSPENQLAKYDPLPIEMLNNAPILHFVAPTGRDLDVEKILAQITPRIVYTTNFDYSLISMARQNLGICLVPGLIAENEKDGVVLKKLSPPCYRTLGIAVPQLSDASPTTRSFIESAKAVVKKIKGKTTTD